MRDCLVKMSAWIPYDEKNKIPGYWKKDAEFKAKFHCWGLQSTLEKPFFNYSIGIVELEDGKIKTVSPEQIQFIIE